MCGCVVVVLLLVVGLLVVPDGAYSKMYRKVLPKLMNRENLQPSEVEQAVCDILSLQENFPVSEYICISSFLTLLRSKGESPGEIAAMVRAMKRVCVPVRCGYVIRTRMTSRPCLIFLPPFDNRGGLQFVGYCWDRW